MDKPTTPLLPLPEKTLIQHLLPEPSHPRAKYRTISTSILILIILVPLWLTVFDNRKEGEGLEDEMPEQGLGWVEFKQVNWGKSRTETALTTTEGSKGEGMMGMDHEEVDWSSMEDTVLPEFSKDKVASVQEMVKNGSMGNFVWHNTLELDNQTDSGTAGRLIIVGDLHGSHTQLSALLNRISFSPSHDTLLHTGDLISKSPLNASLSTLSLIRKLGAKGVRGNHDQGVLEWRAWMEGFGPLDLNLGGDAKETGTQTMEELDEELEGDEGEMIEMEVEEEVQKEKANVDKEGREPKKGGSRISNGISMGVKRWFWSGSAPTATEDKLDEDLEEAEIEEEEALKDEDGGGTEVKEEEEETPPKQKTTPPPIIASNSTSSHHTTLTPTSSHSNFTHARPLSSHPTNSTHAPHTSNSTHTSRPSIQRPSLDATHGVSHSTLHAAGALLGPSYEWLTLPVERVKELGIEIPKGWEWGGEWFELARHLVGEDVQYLRELPLTLWIEDLRLYLVHAGLVPWTDEKTSAVSSTSSPSIPSTLDSLSLSSFSPSKSTLRTLSSTSRTSLLLVSQNTSPFTLQNLRTLDTKSWRVSKGKKGVPWYDIWNEEMERCRDAKECEEVNVVYGHWAGQGLTVEKNSIGLDSACYQGGRLSALVIPLSTNASSKATSPLSPKTTTASAYRILSNSTHAAASLDDSSFVPGRKTPGKKRMDLVRRQKFGAGAIPSAAAPSINALPKVSQERDYEEEEVDLGGKTGWVVSVACN